MMKITEKSDVYSYGVVMLEVLTGKQPIDPTIPDGVHVVDWVREMKETMEILDPSLLLSRPESEIEEITQAFGIALLCVSSIPDERPTMKDVAAMLKEIKNEKEDFAKVEILFKDNKCNGSSSTMAKENLFQKSHHNNNTSFSASSLLYSSSSSINHGFKK